MSVENRGFCEIVRGNSHSLINAAFFADTGRNCISLEAVMLGYLRGTPCQNCRKRICLSEVGEPCPHCGFDALTGKIVEPEAREIEVETREIEGTKCVNCPEVIPSFLDICPSCGWEKRQAA